MKIRTQEILTDYLSESIAWRKKELSDLKTLIDSKSDYPHRKYALLRCGIALLYAHFEGFTKQASQAYLEYVAAQRLPPQQLASNFLALSFCHTINDISDSRKPSAFAHALKVFSDPGISRLNIPYKTGINTESNLSSSVLKEIIWVLGFDYICYETKEKLIDGKLLARRNKIAHGERLSMDIHDYTEVHEAVIEMINTLKNQIENAASLKSYRRALP